MKDLFPKAFRIFMVAAILIGGGLWLDYEAKKGTKEQSALGSIIKTYQSFTKVNKKTAKKKKKKNTAAKKNATNSATNQPDATKETAKKKAKKTTPNTENTTTQQDPTKSTGGYVDDTIKEKARQEALDAAREIYNQTQTQK